MVEYHALGKKRPLNQIVCAGAHDAGVSSGASNVRTQSLDILGQAMAGVRFFDIRIAGSATSKSTASNLVGGKVVVPFSEKGIAELTRPVKGILGFKNLSEDPGGDAPAFNGLQYYRQGRHLDLQAVQEAQAEHQEAGHAGRRREHAQQPRGRRHDVLDHDRHLRERHVPRQDDVGRAQHRDDRLRRCQSMQRDSRAQRPDGRAAGRPDVAIPMPMHR